MKLHSEKLKLTCKNWSKWAIAPFRYFCLFQLFANNYSSIFKLSKVAIDVTNRTYLPVIKNVNKSVRINRRKAERPFKRQKASMI